MAGAEIILLVLSKFNVPDGPRVGLHSDPRGKGVTSRSSKQRSRATPFWER